MALHLKAIIYMLVFRKLSTNDLQQLGLLATNTPQTNYKGYGCIFRNNHTFLYTHWHLIPVILTVLVAPFLLT